MVNIFVKNKDILCDFRGTEVFSDVVDILKSHHCRFDPNKKVWKISLPKLDKVLEDLKNLEVVSISAADLEAIEDIKRGDPELKLSEKRLLFHPELLRFPPFKGKHPNEDFQKQDILRAINRNRYGMFLDMGLGKSYEAAAIIAHLRYYNKANKVLFISSNIGAANVVHEFLKFMYISPEEIICMTKAGKDRELFKQDKSIIITNYNTFRVVCEYYYKKQHPKAKKAPKRMGAPVLPIEQWLGGKPGILMLDESHALGDPDSQQTNRILLHTDPFEYRYLFTGTPADKNEKLYAQLKVLDRALVHDYSYCEWKEEYNNLGNKYSSYAINPNGWKYDKLQKLNQLIVQKYGVYRNGEDHLELPENRIKKLYLTMEPNHREIYQSFVRKTLEDIRDTRGSLFTRDIVNSFPYMQMALDNPKNIVEMHPDLLSPELTKAIRSFSMEEDHAKIEVVRDILAERFDMNPKDKGIIWIWHPATAKVLTKMLEKYHPLFIIGETEDRMSLVEKFKKDEEHRILIASIPVLNTSITITEASFQIYLERTYNYSQYSQSMARIHRIGQKKVTVTYVPLFDYTIDVLLDKNLESKDTLNTKLLSKEFLSLKEWSEIFNMTETSTLGWFTGTDL